MSRRENLRNRLILYENSSKYKLVKLFDLWIENESLEDPTQRKIAVSHAIRELMDALYQAEVLRSDLITTVEYKSEIEEIVVPKSLNKKITIDRTEKVIRCSGILSNKEKELLQEASESEAFKWVVHQLYRKTNRLKDSERLAGLMAPLDPLGKNALVIEAFSIEFFKLKDYFAAVSHSKGITIEETAHWDNKLVEVEEILLSILDDNEPIFKKIREAVAQSEPSLQILVTLAPLIHRNTATFNFFFNQIDHRWLKTIIEWGVFKKIPDIVIEGSSIIYNFWGPSAALVKFASQEPQQVYDVIKSMTFSENSDPWIIGDIINCLVILADKISIKPLINRLREEKWISRNHMVMRASMDLFRILLSKGQYLEASILFESMMDFDSADNTHPIPHMDQHNLRTFYDISRAIPTNSNLKSMLFAISKMLGRVLIARESEWDGDLSKPIKFKGHALADHEELLRLLFVEVFKKYLASIPHENEQTLLELIDKQLKDFGDKKEGIEYSILVAIPERFPQTIGNIISSDAIFAYSTRQIFLPKLKEILVLLDPDRRASFLNHLLTGPEDKEDIEHNNYVRAKIISPIKDLLKPEEIAPFDALQLDYSSDLEGIAVTGGWTEPPAPLTLEQLETLSVAEILAVLETWEPENGIFRESRSTLGLRLAEEVANNPRKFEASIDDFYTSKISAIYLFNILDGFKKALTSGANFNIQPLIKVLIRIAEDSKEGINPNLGEVGQRSVSQDDILYITADLLSGIAKIKEEEKQKELGPLLVHALFALGDNRGSEIRSAEDDLAHRSHRAVCIRAFRTYIAFLYRLPKSSELRSSDIIRKLFDELKRNAYEDDRFAYLIGQQSATSFELNPDYTIELLNELLGADNLVLASSAWVGYSHSVVWFPLAAKISSRFRYFIQTVLPANNSIVLPETVELVGKRLSGNFLFNVNEDAEEIFDEFLKSTNSTVKSAIIFEIGRTFLHRRYNSFFDPEESKEIDQPPVEKLLSVWDKMLDSEENEALGQFGWWIKDEVIPRQDMLPRLLRTLVQTKGKIEPFNEVSDVLIKSLDHDFFLTLSCLDLMIQGMDSQRVIMEYRGGALKDLFDVAAKEENEEVQKLVKKIRSSLLGLGLTEYLG